MLDILGGTILNVLNIIYKIGLNKHVASQTENLKVLYEFWY